MRKLRKLCFVVASEMTVKAFLTAHIMALSEHYDVTLVVNTDQPDFAEQNGLAVTVIPLAIERAINPIADIRALFCLLRIFRQHRFDLIHSVTPKAGLLAMLAGKMASVRFRIHTFTGQVWATRRGFSRLLLKSMDRILALSATHLLADSRSQRQFLIEQGITRAEKLDVLADGSISGVNIERFRPDNEARTVIRRQMAISDDDMLLLFLGRLNRDKGVLDMAAAFADVADSCAQLHLLLVGPDEGGLKESIRQLAGTFSDRLHFINYTDKPETCFAAADIFCLPSYREGFGSVIIEAAACGLPTIGSNIYGVCDAIEDGETGLLFPSGDTVALAAAIRRVVEQSDLRQQMGAAALARATNSFSQNRLVHAWLDYYDRLL